MPISFVKMHGLGNDFVILDSRKNHFVPNAEQVRRIADRHRGVGCDQLIVLAAPKNKNADVYMQIMNGDGSTAGACGNATRCVAVLEMQARGSNQVLIETSYDCLQAKAHGANITVDMGAAQMEWRDIPLALELDTLNIEMEIDGLPPAVGVSMGNPHAVFFIDDAERMDVARLGPRVERHVFFPQRTNVEFVEVIDRTHLRMRVWERGMGITQACGSGACAVAVAAVRRGLAERKVEIMLDGGVLQLEWLENGRVQMTGPVAYSFSGELSDTLLNG